MFVYTGTIGRSACGRSVMIGQVTLWSIRSSLLKARSKPLSRPSRRMWAARFSWPASCIRGRPNSRSSLYQFASKNGALPTRNCGMLSSHSWWKWSLPTITSTSGSAWVKVARKASILVTHSSANGGRSEPTDVLAR